MVHSTHKLVSSQVSVRHMVVFVLIITILLSHCLNLEMNGLIVSVGRSSEHIESVRLIRVDRKSKFAKIVLGQTLTVYICYLQRNRSILDLRLTNTFRVLRAFNVWLIPLIIILISTVFYATLVVAPFAKLSCHGTVETCGLL